MEGLRHSGLGIASFILSIVSGILMFLTLAAAGVVENAVPGGVSAKPMVATVIGILIFAFLGLSLLALGLGIAALFQKDRKRVFAILGTIFSGITVVGTACILIIGVIMG